MFGQFGGQFGAEADAGDIEEKMAVDLAQVDGLCASPGDDLRRLDRIIWNPEGSGEIVRRAERQNPERQSRIGEPGSCRVQRAVAAADDHEIAMAGAARDHIGETLALGRLCFLDRHARGFQHRTRFGNGTGAATGARIDEKQGMSA